MQAGWHQGGLCGKQGWPVLGASPAVLAEIGEPALAASVCSCMRRLVAEVGLELEHRSLQGCPSLLELPSAPTFMREAHRRDRGSEALLRG